MRILIFGLIVLLGVLHQDFWWRGDHQTLLLGVLPVSLAYHMGISIAACALWGLACRYCWPRNVDVPDEDAWVPPGGGRGH
jgi:hypothetical protein